MGEVGSHSGRGEDFVDAGHGLVQDRQTARAPSRAARALPSGPVAVWTMSRAALRRAWAARSSALTWEHWARANAFEAAMSSVRRLAGVL